MSKSALIFGASGVTGWAFVNEILNDYPKKGIWKNVHAMTNRPLKKEASEWPNDDRLEIVSGIDLLKDGQSDLERELTQHVENIKDVTHVYYLAYKASSSWEQEYKDADDMFKRAVIAIDHLCPKLEFVVLQTGAKMYGCHLLENHPTDYLHVPHKESQQRLKSPYGEKLFYHPQLDFIADYAARKSWSWCDTRPDIIIGFVPNQNFYSLGTSLSVFLSLWKEVEGSGSECPFPGSQKAYNAKSNDSSSDMIARQTLHLSLSPDTKKGEGYNVADEKTPRTWETKWPELCSYFGLKGVPPPKSDATEVRAYIKRNIGAWHQLEEKQGLKHSIADSEKTFAGSEYFLLTMFDFDREYDMTKMYGTGFSEERGTLEAWGGVFDRMKKAKMIPS
ncbi:hypothetical protein BJ878DRAFT_311979 [Calycina marina]|uniref:PRISE-like Rossmann-fold domain-containing protein n=1 Tax=Calycina marina TaxID=1763456 RepID=A0A9P8CCF6_9HELO|nr:hypothetical protein BJ878DRAFT_311979 [Calycina marina]